MTNYLLYFFYNIFGDYMKIYIDLLILLNFILDFLLLMGVGIILNRQTNLKKIFISSIIGSITIISLFFSISSFSLFLIKLIISIIMVIVTFGYRDIYYTLKNLFYLYTICIILGGFFYYINIEFNLLLNTNGIVLNFIILLLCSPVVLYFYIKQIKDIKLNYNNYYNIDVYLKNGKIIELTAFLDTGNKLIDPYKKRPIILINKDKLGVNFNIENYLLVPYDTVDNHGLLKCLVPDKIYIHNVGIRNNFLIGISEEKIKIDGVDCILNKMLLEEKII